MVTSYQLIRFWRVIILAMLMVSFVGPWFLELLWVPVEYDCAPNIRLDENFCGVPNSFAKYVSSIISSDISSISSGVFRVMSLEELSREYSFRFLFFVAILPVIGSLLSLWKPARRSIQIFNRICWGLAALLGLGSLLFPEMTHSALWGFWLYRATVLLALVWEWLLFRKVGGGSPGLDSKTTPV